jgi:hypothetical protein
MNLWWVQANITIKTRMYNNNRCAFDQLGESFLSFSHSRALSLSRTYTHFLSHTHTHARTHTRTHTHTFIDVHETQHRINMLLHKSQMMAWKAWLVHNTSAAKAAAAASIRGSTPLEGIGDLQVLCALYHATSPGQGQGQGKGLGQVYRSRGADSHSACVGWKRDDNWATTWLKPENPESLNPQRSPSPRLPSPSPSSPSPSSPSLAPLVEWHGVFVHGREEGGRGRRGGERAPGDGHAITARRRKVEQQNSVLALMLSDNGNNHHHHHHCAAAQLAAPMTSTT